MGLFLHRTLKKTCRYLFNRNKMIINNHIFDTAYKIEYPGSGCVSNLNNCNIKKYILPSKNNSGLCMPQCF